MKILIGAFVRFVAYTSSPSLAVRAIRKATRWAEPSSCRFAVDRPARHNLLQVGRIDTLGIRVVKLLLIHVEPDERALRTRGRCGQFRLLCHRSRRRYNRCAENAQKLPPMNPATSGRCCVCLRMLPTSDSACLTLAGRIQRTCEDERAVCVFSATSPEAARR
jgi:hypothetical protein